MSLYALRPDDVNRKRFRSHREKRRQPSRFTIYRERESKRIAERLKGTAGFSRAELVTATLQVIEENDVPRDSTVIEMARRLSYLRAGGNAHLAWSVTRLNAARMLSPEVYSAFIKPIELVGMRGKLMYVRVPDEIRGRYEETLREAAPKPVADVMFLGPAEALR